MSARRNQSSQQQSPKKSPKAPAKAAEVEVAAVSSIPPGDQRRLTLGLGLFLALITAVVYWPVTGFEFINYDDHDYVTENYHVLAGLTWAGVKWAFSTVGTAGNWHPLTWLSHMLDVQLFGLRAGGHHFTNLLFHIANTVLLFGLLRKLTGVVWRPALVAALFALHPLHVESVAWVAERKDVLSAFFGLLALICYANHVVQSKVQSPRSKVFYAAALFFFACGLLSKPMLVTWPFVMLLLDYWPLQRVLGFKFWVLSWRKLLVEKIPFFVLSAVSCVVTFIAQKRGGAVESLAGMPLTARWENAVVSYARYLGKTFWPVDLANPYPLPDAWPASMILIATLLVVALSVVAIWLGRSRRYWFTGWFWFAGMLVPVIGLVQVGTQAMADRYMYLPAVGLFLIIVWSVAELAARFRLPILIQGAIAVLVVVGCGIRTSGQVACWRNSGTLARQAMKVTRNNDVACSNLGNYLIQIGRLDEAIDYYRQAIMMMQADQGAKRTATNGAGEAFLEFNPKKVDTAADVLNNLGAALARTGHPEEALEHYRGALKLNPNDAPALHNLGHDLMGQQKYAEAIGYLEAAVKVKPDRPEIRETYGNALVGAGRTDEAMAQFAEALRLAPDNASLQNSVGLALAGQGKPAEAMPHYQAALKADPKLIEVHNNLGSALVNVGRLDEAIAQFRELLRQMPEHPRAHDNLGVALASKGQLDEAVAQLREAIRLSPDFAQTHFNLGNVLAMQRDFAAAEKEYAEAVRLQPELAQAHCNLGSVLVELGRRDEAVGQFKEALRLGYEPARAQLQQLGVTP